MKKFKEMTKVFFARYGAIVAACAFAFVALSANTSCGLPYYEPEEPMGLDKLKKFNK